MRRTETHVAQTLIRLVFLIDLACLLLKVVVEFVRREAIGILLLLLVVVVVVVVVVLDQVIECIRILV
jgi:hypothetical protein